MLKVLVGGGGRLTAVRLIALVRRRADWIWAPNWPMPPDLVYGFDMRGYGCEWYCRCLVDLRPSLRILGWAKWSRVLQMTVISSWFLGACCALKFNDLGTALVTFTSADVSISVFVYQLRINILPTCAYYSSYCAYPEDTVSFIFALVIPHAH